MCGIFIVGGEGGGLRIRRGARGSETAPLGRQGRGRRRRGNDPASTRRKCPQVMQGKFWKDGSALPRVALRRGRGRPEGCS